MGTQQCTSGERTGPARSASAILGGRARVARHVPHLRPRRRSRRLRGQMIQPDRYRMPGMAASRPPAPGRLWSGRHNCQRAPTRCGEESRLVWPAPAGARAGSAVTASCGSSGCLASGARAARRAGARSCRGGRSAGTVVGANRVVSSAATAGFSNPGPPASGRCRSRRARALLYRPPRAGLPSTRSGVDATQRCGGDAPPSPTFTGALGSVTTLRAPAPKKSKCFWSGACLPGLRRWIIGTPGYWTTRGPPPAPIPQCPGARPCAAVRPQTNSTTGDGRGAIGTVAPDPGSTWWRGPGCPWHLEHPPRLADVTRERAVRASASLVTHWRSS